MSVGLKHLSKYTFLGAGEMAQSVENTDCSFRGPGFNSQYLYGGLQLVILVPGYLTPSYRNICRNTNTSAHFKKRVYVYFNLLYLR